MATILLPSSKTKDATAKDPSLRAKIGPFISKLSTMTTSSGLHLEPIRGSRDRRVRTARVTDFYRAVLFELTADGEVVYVIHGIWPHDEAIKIAESVTVHVNPRNGITEVVNVGDLIGLDPRAVEEARRTAQAELAAAGTDTTHYHSFTPQEAAVMGARSALRHPAALAAWFLRIHKAH